MPKYPNIYVPLVGEDGNAFAIIARAHRAMRAAGLSADEIALFTDDAMSSDDYGCLLLTVMNYFDTFGGDESEDEDEDDYDWV